MNANLLKMNANLHGKIINYSGSESLSIIPQRCDFLNSDKVKEMDEIIKNEGEFMFLPNSIEEIHEKNVDGDQVYNILMFGITPDGRKSAVILEGIVPYFEVKKPDYITEEKFQQKVDSVLSEKFGKSYSKKILAKGFNEYEEMQSVYMRIFCPTKWIRTNVLKYFTETLQWKTTTDDKYHFERVACRDNDFSMCSWNIVKKFKSYKKEKVCKLPKVFRVHYKDFIRYDGDITADYNLSRDKTIVETWDIEAYTETGELPNPANDGDVVFAIGKTYHWKDSKESIFDVCLISRPCNPRPDKLTIYCKSEKDLIKASFELNRILMPDYIIGFNDGDFDWPFVLTKAVKYDILVFIQEQLSLSVIKTNIRDKKTGRWRNMNKKERNEAILRWSCRKMQIKLEADTVAYSTTMAMPGYITIDVRTMFRKLYPTEPKSSLKYFLEMCNLGGKEDMPIHELFRIFKESLEIEADIKELSMNDEIKVCEKDKKDKKDKLIDLQERMEKNKERMADIAHYCTIDAKRCQELMQKVNIISDKREVSNVSHTSLYDAIYYADGMKVRNLVISEGRKRGLLISTIPKPHVGDGQYPGAYVFPPLKGVVKPKLSLQERKDKKGEWEDVEQSDIDKMQNAIEQKWSQYTEIQTELKHINKHKNHNKVKSLMGQIFEECGKLTSKKSKELLEEFITEENKYPISGLDFSSLYPSIIMAYNLSPEYMVLDENKVIELQEKGHQLHKIEFKFNGESIIAWSIRHDTFDGKKLLPGKKDNKFGLYPTILKNLFDKRSLMKKELKKFAKRKEILEKEGKQDTDEYSKVSFSYNYINSKQKALKVFMNTFYGETGNKNSPSFILAIAGGITSAGQRNIKMIADLVTRNVDPDKETGGCKLYYGDTDSCYISCPDKFFYPIDKEYYTGKIGKKDYCTRLVNETFKQIDVVNKVANEHLIADNGTGFLKMAYEEVLYPCMFFLKKMYAGVEHQSIVNFEPHPEELFTKGLSLKRRGTSKVLKTVCVEVLMDILNINNTETMMDIIKVKIKEIYSREWKLEDFKKSAVYKPSKQNISVRTFLQRMVERNDPSCPPPPPGERFEYVVAQKYPFKYDIRGRKTKLKVGEMWEYYSYACEKKIKINLDYYMTGGIIGQFAQFAAYHKKFQVIPIDNSPEAYDAAEKKTLNTSKKFIEELCKAMIASPPCKGPMLKELYRIANSSYGNTIERIYEKNNAEDGISEKVKLLNFKGESVHDSLYLFIKNTIECQVSKSSDKYGDSFVKYMIKKHGGSIVYSISNIFSTSNKIKPEDSLMVYRIKHVEKVEHDSSKLFMENMAVFEELFKSRNSIIVELLSEMKEKLDIKDEYKLPDHKKIKENIDCDVICEEKYCEKIEEHRESIDKLYFIYNGLKAAISYLENTKAIIKYNKFYTGKLQKTPLEINIPVGVNTETVKEEAKEFLNKQKPLDIDTV